MSAFAHIAAAPARCPAAPRPPAVEAGRERPLEPGVRRTMEARFGRDFSAVRVHDDARAAAAARERHAAAFAVGEHVVFAAGRYAPATDRGRELLAHELAHTLQQADATATAEPLAEGSPLEAHAAEAGRAAANGLAVREPRRGAGVGVARQKVNPELLGNDELIAELGRVNEKLKQPSYPGREDDLKWARELARVGRGRIARSKPAGPPAPAPGPSAPVGAPFASEPITDETIYAEYRKTEARLAAETAPAPDPRPFAERFEQARREAPWDPVPAVHRGAIWSYGVNAGLFAAKELGAVLEALDAPAAAKAGAELDRLRAQAAYEQQLRFESFRSQLQLGTIQGALVGGAGVYGQVVRDAYTAYSVADTEVQAVRAAQSGSGRDVVGAVLPVVGGLALGRVVGAGEPAPETGAPARAAGPEEVTPEQVRAAYAAEPDSVKKPMSNAWHQFVWELKGGEGLAPLAFRSGRVIVVNEARWSTVGDVAEINQPQELVAPRPAAGGAQVDPLARTEPAPGPVDPLAKTQSAPAEQAAAGQETKPSAPPAPKPRGRRGAARAQAMTAEEALAAVREDRGSLHVSKDHDWHLQIWLLDLGEGPVPPVFRVGRTILVDPDVFGPEGP